MCECVRVCVVMHCQLLLYVLNIPLYLGIEVLLHCDLLHNAIAKLTAF